MDVVAGCLWGDGGGVSRSLLLCGIWRDGQVRGLALELSTLDSTTTASYVNPCSCQILQTPPISRHSYQYLPSSLTSKPTIPAPNTLPIPAPRRLRNPPKQPKARKSRNLSCVALRGARDVLNLESWCVVSTSRCHCSGIGSGGISEVLRGREEREEDCH